MKTHDGLEYFEVLQGPKEIIFVPSGWYHQVTNVTDTLSINHNWFNGTNIDYIWIKLERELKRVQAEMADCFEQNNHEWKDMCQNLLLASHGMNYSTFVDLLGVVSANRIEVSAASFDHWTYGPRHVQYDLEKVGSVLKSILKSGQEDLLDKDVVKINEILGRMYS